MEQDNELVPVGELQQVQVAPVFTNQATFYIYSHFFYFQLCQFDSKLLLLLSLQAEQLVPAHLGGDKTRRVFLVYGEGSLVLEG